VQSCLRELRHQPRDCHDSNGLAQTQCQDNAPGNGTRPGGQDLSQPPTDTPAEKKANSGTAIPAETGGGGGSKIPARSGQAFGPPAVAERMTGTAKLSITPATVG
jgi:hypothetical protein